MRVILAIIGLALTFVTFLFALLGHGNEMFTYPNGHAGIWKSCSGDVCDEIG